MADVFQIDLTDIAKLTRGYKAAPRKVARATGDMLNEFAFGTRLTAIESINTRMTVRNRRFVESRLRVEKARGRLPISRQAALTGSITADRFSGWREQVTGERTARKRVINKLARFGNEKRQAKPAARMKRGKEFEKFSNYPGGSPNMRSTKMLQALDRKRWKKPFYLTKKKGVQPGLWFFYRGKLRPLQLFKPGKKVKRIDWMTDARGRYFSRADLGRLWGSKLRRHLLRRGLR